MQFSEKWLRQLVNPAISSVELAHQLTMAGLEVEDMRPAAPSFSEVVVGHVLAISPHPHADRLHICQVSVGSGEPLTIVCGAQNVSVGMKVPCAKLGAILPLRGEEQVVKITSTDIRGVMSSGMLCSAYELGISEEKTGLMDLPRDAPVGENIRHYLDLDDSIFTIKLTPNRADCLSLFGVAREVAALTGASLSLPSIVSPCVTLHEKIPVHIASPDLCGRFVGRIIRNVNAKAPTPQWMQTCLIRSGQRPISALVDISNYVMLECGQPTHIFDLDKLAGDITIRWGKQGEQLHLLNGRVVQVDESIGVVASDDSTVLESLAGIMGGEATSVNLDTQHIYVEAAFWWPHAIQGRTRSLRFTTDAAYRFERGVDFKTTALYLERVTQLIVDICGGEVGVLDDQVLALPTRSEVGLRPARLNDILGIQLTPQEIKTYLSCLGFACRVESDHFLVTPPSFRFDIEIEEDLIEEVARMHGFDRIPAKLPIAQTNMVWTPQTTRTLFDIRHHLAHLDYQEVINYSFVDEAWERDLMGSTDPIRVKNPLASHMGVMRSTLLGGLIANLRFNVSRQLARVRLFESAVVYERDKTEAAEALAAANIRETKKIAGLAYGPFVEEQWGVAHRKVDFFDVKADIEALFAPKTLKWEKTTHPALHPGRAAQMICDGEVVGILGELHPVWQQQYDLMAAPILFEITAHALQKRDEWGYKKVSKFPFVTRDVALVVDVSISVQMLLDLWHKTCKNHAHCHIVKHIGLFDQYQGIGLEKNQKSLAFRCILQDTESTLRDEVVDAVIDTLLTSVKEQFKAQLRQ